MSTGKCTSLRASCIQESLLNGPHSRLLWAQSHTLTSKACERVCYLDMLSYHHLHLLLRFTSIPYYCSHVNFIATEITETGFLCIILFCYGLLSFASWWQCDIKALSKCTQTLQKKVSPQDPATLPGQLSEYVPFVHSQTERRTRMYITKCWLHMNSMFYLFKCYRFPIPLHCNLSIVIFF